VTDLSELFSSEVVEAIRKIVREEIAAALAELENGALSPWLSIPEAAAHLRVSERTVERMIRRGKVRSSTVGRRRLLLRDDLDVATSDLGGLR
jgi:excisionase family DNA binding protein